MSRRGRAIGASLTLAGFLCTSILAQVDALHVGLEHHAAPTASHSFSTTESSHSHQHGVTVHAAGPDAGLDAVSHGEAPEHGHVLAPMTELQLRPEETAAAPLFPDSAAVAPVAATAISGALPAAILSGPGARAAPASRRTVVLQV